MATKTGVKLIPTPDAPWAVNAVQAIKAELDKLIVLRRARGCRSPGVLDLRSRLS